MRRLSPLILWTVIHLLACIYTYRLELPETRSWPAPSLTSLEASTRNGHIHISLALDSLLTAHITRWCYGRDSADAARALENITLKDTVNSGRLSLLALVPGGSRSCGVHYDLYVPESIPLTLSTSNGTVSITGITADVSAATTNADIEVMDTKGSLNLSTSNGKVRIRVHRGSVAVSTSGQAIECDLAELRATESASLGTSNGKITLYLPANISATFEAITSNGDITISGFGLVSYEKSERAHKRGRIGSGASVITLFTSNADIVIRAR